MADDYISEHEDHNKSSICSYQIDFEDELWIEHTNFIRNQKKLLLIEPFNFLKIINILETDLYLAIARVLLQQLAASRYFFDDPETVACDICYLPDCEPDDNIVFCESCESVVHQSCYGLDVVPENAWFCDLCLLEKANTKCLLCPLPNGTMKKTACGSGLVHISCALWIPEVKFDDAIHREGIVINNKKKFTRELPICEVCTICYGSYVKCSMDGCYQCYHVTCGQRSGFTFIVEPSGRDEKVEFVSYCKKHTEELADLGFVYNNYTRSSPVSYINIYLQF